MQKVGAEAAQATSNPERCPDLHGEGLPNALVAHSEQLQVRRLAASEIRYPFGDVSPLRLTWNMTTAVRAAEYGTTERT